MPDTAQALLGHFVDGRFPLRKLLGVSSNSAVFLTEIAADRPSDPAADAAIKLIPDDPETSDQQLARWEAASALSHPGLLRILHCGRCDVDGSHCLYLVTEPAKENLGEILPQRALTPDETGGMLGPVLATLDFLHENGLVHAGLKPSNILAIGDNIKLSPDRILPAGESSSSRPLAAPYAPPESLWFPASDIWSLGISLYETLTQYLPNHDSAGRYVLPQLPAPFSEIVRGALVEDPAQRITLDEIRAQLDPAFVPRRKIAPIPATEPVPEAVAQTPSAATEPPVAVSQPVAAAVGAAAPAQAPQAAPLPERDPLSVPLSPVAPKGAEQPAPSRIPVSSLPNVNVTIAAARRPAAPRTSRGSFKFFILGAVGTLLVAALILPRLLRNPAESSSSRASTAAGRAARSAEASGASSTANNSAAPARTSAAPSTTAAASKASAAVSATAAPRTYSSASAQSASLPSAPARPVTSFDSAGPRVLHQAFPEVSRKALGTIRGTVRVNVRVELTADGSVSSSQLQPPVVSQFFADLALKAVPQWRFAPGSGSSALIRFVFTSSGASASVTP